MDSGTFVANGAWAGTEKGKQQDEMIDVMRISKYHFEITIIVSKHSMDD